MDMTVQNDYGTTLEEMKRRMEYVKKRTAQRSSNKTKRNKKKLSYNQREISGQLMHVTRPVGAAQVVIRAKGKVAQLQKCLATGQYDEKEVRAALAHAKRMVKAAKMKLKHLEGEEEVVTEMRKRKFPEKNNAAKQRELRLLEGELKKLRRRNRGKEDREVRDALMRYMQQKENLARMESQAQQSTTTTASPETTMVAVETMPAGEVGVADTVSIDVCL